MKHHILVNHQNEEISFKLNASDIEIAGDYDYMYTNYPFGSLEDNINAYTRFRSNYRLKYNNPLEYDPNKEYFIGDVVKFNNQLFMNIIRSDDIPTDRTTDKTPNMYSSEWIAITDAWGNKCVAYYPYIDTGSGDIMRYKTYGSFGLPDIEDMLQLGTFYQYYNDGDYFLAEDSSHNFYKMRMNYVEVVNENGSTVRRIDCVSDELIPYISFKINTDFGVENDSYSLADEVVNEYIWEISKMGKLLSQYDDNFVPNILLGRIKPKGGYYRTYSRSRRLDRGGSYTNNISNDANYESTRKIADNNNADFRFWLPTEKEAFGISYGIIDGYIESDFQQLKSLNTAYKRVKTVNGVPKPWATYTMYKNTKYPCIVGEDGTMLPMDLLNSNGNSYDKDIYMPLCFSIGHFKTN